MNFLPLALLTLARRLTTLHRALAFVNDWVCFVNINLQRPKTKARKTFRKYKRIEMPALNRKDLLPISVSSAVDGLQVDWPVSRSTPVCAARNEYLRASFVRWTWHLKWISGINATCQVKLNGNLYQHAAQQSRFKKESPSAKYSRIMKRCTVHIPMFPHTLSPTAV